MTTGKRPPGPSPRAWGSMLPSALAIKEEARAAFHPVSKLERIATAFGLNVAAAVLSVDRGFLSRAMHRKATISPPIARRITDLEYVLDRALALMHSDEVGPWLTMPEALLGGSIPLNVLVLTGPARVVAALDARAAGAFA